MLNGILPLFLDICTNVHRQPPLCKLNLHEDRGIGTCEHETPAPWFSTGCIDQYYSNKNKRQQSWFESFVRGDVFYVYPFFFPTNWCDLNQKKIAAAFFQYHTLTSSCHYNCLEKASWIAWRITHLWNYHRNQLLRRSNSHDRASAGLIWLFACADEFKCHKDFLRPAGASGDSGLSTKV